MQYKERLWRINMIDWVTTTTLNKDIEIIYEYIYQESVIVEEVI